MRHTIWTAPLIAGALAAAAALSPAAADECLSAPNGTAAKGQHWHYHLDRATHRKCWYLRDAAAGSVAPQSAGSAARPAPQAASSDGAAAQPGRPDPGAAAPASPPPQAAPEAEAPVAPQSTGSIWADPPPASTAGAPDAGAAPMDPPSSSAATEPQQAPLRQAASQNQTAQVAAAERKHSTGSLPENLLIVALAAALAAFTFAGFVLARSRRVAKAPLVPAAPAGPRFGSGGARLPGARWKAEATDEPPLPAIEASLIPEQVPMPLPPLDARR